MSDPLDFETHKSSFEDGGSVAGGAGEDESRERSAGKCLGFSFRERATVVAYRSHSVTLQFSYLKKDDRCYRISCLSRLSDN